MAITDVTCAVTRSWTGAETVITTGIFANSAEHIVVWSGAEKLTRDLHYSSSLDAGHKLQITPLAAMPAPPKTLTIQRFTPAKQPDNLSNGNSYDAESLELGLDTMAMVCQEAQFLASAAQDRSSFVANLVDQIVLTGPVQRVNNKIGDVVLTHADLGAIASGDVDETFARDIGGALSVLAYGADRGGLAANWTTNRDAFQAAIDALPATGGAVLVPPGDYYVADFKLNGSARTKANVTLRGPRSARLIFPPGATAKNMIDALGALGCAIEGLTLDGNRGNVTIPALTDGPDYEGWNLVYGAGAERLELRGVRLQNAGSVAVCAGAPWVNHSDWNLSPPGSNFCKVVNCEFYNCRTAVAGMRMYQATVALSHFKDTTDDAVVVDEYSESCKVTANEFSGVGRHAIFAFRSHYGIISHNAIRYVTSSAIAIDDGATGLLIAQNNIKDVTNGAGISFTDDAADALVTGNVIRSTATNGIQSLPGQSSSGVRLTIVNNDLRFCNWSGIALISMTNALVQGNTCVSCGGSGIYIDACGEFVEVSENKCFDNSTNSTADAGIRLVSSTGVSVLDNDCRDTRTAGSKTQGWGIRANEGANASHIIESNDLRANKTAAQAITEGTHTIRRNRGYVTEASGTAAITSGNSVMVNSGCDHPLNLEDIIVTLSGGIGGGACLGVDFTGANPWEFRVFTTQTQTAWPIYFRWRVLRR